ncbi:hypothetical protein FJ251_12330 [bacterium]|nr:hypothetical protein [bacterium]
MLRRWLAIALTLLTLSGTGACLRAVEVNPEETPSGTALRGNIRVVDRDGIVYIAQSLRVTESGDYLLEMVERIDDGVSEVLMETTLPRAEVVSIRRSETNRWAVAGLVAGTALFMVWLYYKINTSVFD